MEARILNFTAVILNTLISLFVLSSALLPISTIEKFENETNQDFKTESTIVLWDRNYDSDYMRAQVSNLLDLSRDKYGDFTLVSSKPLEQGRAFASLYSSQDGIDVFIGGIDEYREENSKVIYFPMDRGLLGFRLCITSKENTKFQRVSNLQSLLDSGVTIGSGSHWPDTQVFQSSGISVITSPQYKNLFDMLQRNRFDCFPRSVAEISYELEKISPRNLVVENNIAFIYPLAEFIFLNKNDSQLHDRLDYGIQRALENGSFHDIFFKFHDNKIELYNIDERFIIRLDNNSISVKASEAIEKYGIRDGSWR